jgi:hypothetical protein
MFSQAVGAGGVTLLLVLPAALASQERPPGVQEARVVDGVDLPVVEHTLENGLRLLVLPRPTSATVSFVVHVPVGSVNEALGSTGSAHMLEHLLFKGSTTIGTTDVGAERALFRRMDAAFDTVRHLRGQAPMDRDEAARGAREAELHRLEERIRTLEDSARAYVVPNEFDEILSRNGARGLNASTSWEATEYYVELPANRARSGSCSRPTGCGTPSSGSSTGSGRWWRRSGGRASSRDPGGRLWEEHQGRPSGSIPTAWPPSGTWTTSGT